MFLLFLSTLNGNQNAQAKSVKKKTGSRNYFVPPPPPYYPSISQALFRSRQHEAEVSGDETGNYVKEYGSYTPVKYKANSNVTYWNNSFHR
jgi:hypothetical protein